MSPGEIRSLFECKCGNVFPSPAITRATCPACGAFCRTRSDAPDMIRNPRKTLSITQEALEAIAIRARDHSADDIDVAMAKIFTDALKYLTPALEASMVQHTSDDVIIEKLLGAKDDSDEHDPPALPAYHRKVVQDSSEPSEPAQEALESPPSNP